MCSKVNDAYGITPRHVTPPPPDPYFILQVSNISPNIAGAYASATLVVNENYYVFGNEWQKPIWPAHHQSWSTLTSAKPPAIVSSDDLEKFLKNGEHEFTTSQILVNGYDKNDSIYDPKANQVECKLGAGYKFKAGKSYNLMINAKPKEGWPSCDIKEM